MASVTGQGRVGWGRAGCPNVSKIIQELEKSAMAEFRVVGKS